MVIASYKMIKSLWNDQNGIKSIHNSFRNDHVAYKVIISLKKGFQSLKTADNDVIEVS